MPEKNEYAPGTPSWVDLGSPDMAGSVAFYGGLFGWGGDVASQPEAAGYTMFHLRERHVAGVGPAFEGQPPAWATYVSVASADAVAKAAATAGGRVLMGPIDVMDIGRMAVLLDPVGAAVSIWEPRRFPGAQLVNEPGAMCWNELATREVEAAKAFYGHVFGWEGTTREYSGSTYTEFQLGGVPVAGMVGMNDQWPPEVPSHWMVYFAVDDTDAAVRRTESLGGSVSVPPTDIPPGRLAVLNDPQGAVFSIIKMAVPD